MNEQLVSYAIDTLLSKTPAGAPQDAPSTPASPTSAPEPQPTATPLAPPAEVAQIPVAPAPPAEGHGAILPSSDTVVASTSNGSNTVLRNKSIAPLERDPEPSLEELLAREADKPQAVGPPPGAAIAPTPVEEPPVVLPEAAALAAEEQAQTDAQSGTDRTQNKLPFDPNSIAL
jgi:hypothetical protein